MIGLMLYRVFIDKISEWRVKVRGKQSSMRLGSNKGYKGNFIIPGLNWGKKFRVAPESSDLSPHWLNMVEE